jgi:hypothetical protein
VTIDGKVVAFSEANFFGNGGLIHKQCTCYGLY